jgi:hypothetical protein
VNLRHNCALHVINTTGASSVWATTRPDMWKLSSVKQPQSGLRVRASAALYYFTSSFFLPFCPISLYVFIFSLFYFSELLVTFVHSSFVPCFSPPFVFPSFFRLPLHSFYLSYFYPFVHNSFVSLKYVGDLP